MSDDKPRKKHYNPQSPRKNSYKKPPVISELAHIPFDQMDSEISIAAAKINAKALEADLLAVLVKHGVLPENEEGYGVTNGRRMSFAFPSDPRGQLMVDIQQAIGDSGRFEYRSVTFNPKNEKVSNYPTVTTSVVTYPESFHNEMRYELLHIRRIYANASQFQPNTVTEPEVYEKVVNRIAMKDGLPYLTKSFINEGISTEYLHVHLPAEKYLLLNGIKELPEPEVRPVEN